MILLSDIIRLHYLDNQFLIFEFYSKHYLMAFGLYELGKKINDDKDTNNFKNTKRTKNERKETL